MDSATIAGFRDEMEKIAIGMDQIVRTTAKAARPGWSQGRVNQSLKRLMGHEEKQVLKAGLKPPAPWHFPEAPTQMLASSGGATSAARPRAMMNQTSATGRVPMPRAA